MKLKESITCLKGVGAQMQGKLNKLGIFTIQDLLEHYPREYEDRRVVTPIAEMEMGEETNLLATVATKPQVMKKGTRIIVSFRIKDGTGSIFVSFYGQPYMKNNFVVGEAYYFYGVAKQQYGKIQMDSPEYEKAVVEGKARPNKITPIYPVTQKLSQKVLRGLIEAGLKETKEAIPDLLPVGIREVYQLITKAEAVQNIHFPKDDELFFAARRRLVFEELLSLQLSLFYMKSDYMKKGTGVPKKMPEELQGFIDSLPFPLTNAQKKVVREILKDMKSPYVGNRLVQGDVGSGKTVVAAIALFVAAKNGMQGALMAPTEVLAKQHHQFLEEILSPFEIQVGILTGSTTKKQKEQLLEALLQGKIQVLVGTHALIEDNIQFQSLGLVITDEQHRFGVRQRLSLSNKGATPDVVVMTATPIPRTLALILYGDMDVSIIDELPPGRQPIKTNAVDSSYHPRIYAFMQKHIAAGRQCYVICPMVEEGESQTELKGVIEYTAKLSEEVFPGICVAYLHGKMRPKEKNEVMDRFASGEIKVLVSTTVVEVGVNVPNATVMVIENAERFGLAQLHQLRGRVGRGKEQSFCVLVSDSKNKVTKKRLKIMTESTDGFVIADTDLKLRGPGEFFGTRQHGLPEMKIANLYTDTLLVKEAQKVAKDLMNIDPLGEKEENHLLFTSIAAKMEEEKIHQAL